MSQWTLRSSYEVGWTASRGSVVQEVRQGREPLGRPGPLARDLKGRVGPPLAFVPEYRYLGSPGSGPVG